MNSGLTHTFSVRHDTNNSKPDVYPKFVHMPFDVADVAIARVGSW